MEINLEYDFQSAQDKQETATYRKMHASGPEQERIHI
jgi:hypothetical protein